MKSPRLWRIPMPKLMRIAAPARTVRVSARVGCAVTVSDVLINQPRRMRYMPTARLWARRQDNSLSEGCGHGEAFYYASPRVVACARCMKRGLSPRSNLSGGQADGRRDADHYPGARLVGLAVYHGRLGPAGRRQDVAPR